MSHLSVTDELFYDRADLDRGRLERLVDDALAGALGFGVAGDCMAYRLAVHVPVYSLFAFSEIWR